MTVLRFSAIYLAAVSAAAGVGLVSGAFRALAVQGETGVFLLGLVAGMSFWAWALFLVAGATALSNITAALLDGGRGHVEGESK